MRVLVCGGREYANYEELCRVLDKLHAEHGFTLLVHGDAGAYKQGYRSRPTAYKGADALAGRWAEERGIQQVKFPANWNGQDNAAGMIRNQLMLDIVPPDLCVGFPGGVGTNAMMFRAHKAGVKVIDTNDIMFP